MSYGLFDALVARREEEERNEFIRAAMITAAVMNFSMCHPEEHVQVMDLVPGEKKAVDLTKLSPEEQAAHIMNELSKKRITR